YKDGTFRLDSIGAFIRKHLMGRAFPIGVGLAVGYWAGEPTILAAALYTAETVASIKQSLQPSPPDAEEVEISEAVNPIPQD
ncbi:MAG TPA: hypothetical protein VLA89_15830, partial [Gemmatimonadales bacterium]|nr:hypothetical protein [Gemmatimonadales bacterium]